MKTAIRHVSFILSLVGTCQVNADYVFPYSINASSQGHSGYTVTVFGELESTGFVLDSTSVFSTGTSHTIAFEMTSPAQAQLAIFEPFWYTADLGVLVAGEHSITAEFHVDGRLDATLSDSFTVSSVPLPAALWLFSSGALVYTLAGRWSRRAARA